MTQVQGATLEKKIDALTAIVEKGFVAIASDIGDIKEDITYIKGDISYIKEDLFGLHTQIKSRTPRQSLGV